jgi:zinc protease
MLTQQRETGMKEMQKVKDEMRNQRFRQVMARRRQLVFCLWLLVLTPLATTQHFVASQNTPRQTTLAPSAYYDNLLNGLQVILIQRPTDGKTLLNLTYKSGATFDLAGKSATAAITARALLLGAQDLSAATIAGRLTALEAKFDFATTWDSTTITLEAPSRAMPELIQILGRCLSRPTFEEAEFLRFKQQYIAELLAERADPSRIAGSELLKSLYSPHPYSRPALGRAEEAANVTRNDLIRHHSRFFIANTATLVIISDLTPTFLMPLIKPHFGAMLKGKIVLPTFLGPTPAEGVRIKLVDRRDLSESQIRLASFGLERFDEDYFPALVLAESLNLSRLKNLAAARLDFGLRSSNKGVVTISAASPSSQTAPTISDLLRTLGDVRAVGLSAEELAAGKQRLIENYPSQIATERQLAEQIQLIELYGLGRDYPQRFSDRVNQVTLADVKRVAEKYLSTTNLVITIVGRADQSAEELKKLGTVEIAQ